MGRVGIAIDVALQGGVDGNHAQSAYQFGRVGYLALAQGKVLLEVINIAIHLHQALVGHGERAGRSLLHPAVEHHIHHGILQHLGKDVEVGYVLVHAQCSQNGIGSGAHTALQGQEGGGNDAFLHVRSQEGSHVVTYLCGHGVKVFEGACLIGYVTFHHAHNFLGVNLHVGSTYSVIYMYNGYGLAIGRILQFIHVVQVLGIGTVEGVVLQNHVLCQAWD